MAQQAAPKLKVSKVEVEDVIGIVQGIMPDSKNEWYVALALDKLNIEYIFQYSLFGGTAFRGGQVVDFVVYNPNAIPVFIQGEYWHDKKSETEDILKQAAAEAHFKTKPVLLMGEDTDEKDKAYATVRRELGV
jgi:hypothetical protein